MNKVVSVKRTTSNVKMLTPAMTEWIVEPGDKVRVFSPKGDPREPSTDLSQAYLVPEPFILQPSYIRGFVTIDRLSDDEIKQLERVIGQKISTELVSKIEGAIEAFVCTVALQKRLATWKDIEKQLKLIIDTYENIRVHAERFIQLTDSGVLDDSVLRGGFSADQLVKQMLFEIVSDTRSELTIDLGSIIFPCVQAYKEVRAKTKRGRKPEAAFRLFLNRLAGSMKEFGLDLKLPSNENIFNKTHPTFLFLCNVLDLCSIKGQAAIMRSKLDEDEKATAIKAISHYRKSPRAILHYLRDRSLG